MTPTPDYADRESSDAANTKIMSDERITCVCDQTRKIFDCKRMAFGGFKTLVAL